MNGWDALILLTLAALVFLALRRTKRHGGCCGDCSRCGGKCRQEKKEE